MKCPSCGEDMRTRNGKYGVFWYCPKEPKCGQSTIGDSLANRKTTPSQNRAGFSTKEEYEDHASNYGEGGINWFIFYGTFS